MAKKPEKKSEKTPAGKAGEREVAVARRGEVVHPMQRLREEIDEMFETFFGRSPMRAVPRSLWDWAWDWDREPWRELRTRPAALVPRIDVHETDKDYTIEAELPGLEEKDIDLVLREDVLTLKGEKTEEQTEEKKDYHLAERSYGAFRRSFRVPEGVDRDKVSAKFKNGVLKITLPKTAKARKAAKKIAIEA